MAAVPAFVPPRSSSAIRIVAPPRNQSPAQDDKAAANKANPLKKENSQRHCRNILIYGSCKYEGKGCIYYHPPRPDGTSASVSSNSPTPSPTATSAPLPLPVNVNAPVFVPKGTLIPESAPAPAVSPLQQQPQTEQEAPQPPEEFLAPEDPGGVDMNGDGQAQSMPDYNNGQMIHADLANQFGNMEIDPSGFVTPDAHAQMLMQDYNNDQYDPNQFYAPSQPTFVRQPLNYHLYTPLPYIQSSASSSKPSSQRFFLSDSLRLDLQKRSEALLTSAPLALSNLPEEVHTYHSLVPLEPLEGNRRKWFGGWASSVFKAVNSVDGITYCLRRIEGFRLMHETAFAAIESWGRIQHPNIVNVREAFTNRAFGDNSLIFAYDYHPTAQTLLSLHFGPKPSHQQQPYQRKSHNLHLSNHHHKDKDQPHVEEDIIWTYLIQLANAMKTVHDKGLAVRTLDLSKVIVTGKNRVRINCCGIFDVVSYDPRQNIEALQQEDLVQFGKLIFSLCCNNLSAMNNLPKALETLSKYYSADLKNVALFLISKPGPHKVIDQLLDLFGTRLLTEMNSIRSYADEIEGEMMSELENGRLVWLLCKFGFINERPEFNHEPRWSETGDRYIIKLFRDYVFHQVNEMGQPIVNLTHVLTCLNKLDAGTDERIMLVSRDEQNCLVVTYNQVKQCVEAAFAELSQASR